MQAVILAAGRGTRMGALTDIVPKPMLTVAGKTLLEYKFDVLPASISEIIIIVGYLSDVIRKGCGESYKGVPIRYIEQTELNGTMASLACARPYLTDRFLVMMGDDIYCRADVERMQSVGDWAILLKNMERMAPSGRIITDDAGTVVAIEEGNHAGTPGLFNTNMFVLDPRIFAHPMVPKSSGSHEYGLPQTVLSASRAMGIPLHAVYATDWIQITAPEDIAQAERLIEENAVA